MRNQLTMEVFAAVESWPLARPFVISRGAKTAAQVVVATVTDKDGRIGRGECVPYGRYSETVNAVRDVIARWHPDIDRAKLLSQLPPGAARNAIDCALWDYQARRSRHPASEHLDTCPTQPVETAFTLSLATPADMSAAAVEAHAHKLLKLKLGGRDGLDAERMHAVRTARPNVRLIGDANEGWTTGSVDRLLGIAADLNFELIEQPLPDDHDDVLATIKRPLTVCADESHHTADDLAGLTKKYDAINIKLDKAGGLTAAYDAVLQARKLGFDIMVGSMVATSLAIAPAFLLAGAAKWVDLDGPLLLARDRDNGFQFSDGVMTPPASGLWGTPE